jgi:hypothetical protein
MRLNLLLAAVVLVLGYVTCKNFRNKAATDTPAAAEGAPAPGEVVNSPRRAAHVFDTYQPDSARPIQVTTPPKMVRVPLARLPEATASRKAYLSTGWWHINMAYQTTDTTVYRNYKDRYLKFYEDQTFELLYQAQVVDKGRWNWDEAKNEIYLACNSPYFNNTWKVMDKGFVMVWLGNTDVNVTGTQVRVIGTRTDPFK